MARTKLNFEVAYIVDGSLLDGHLLVGILSR